MGYSSFLPPQLAGYQLFETDHFVRINVQLCKFHSLSTQGAKIVAKRLSDNRSNACICHSMPFGKLRINSAKNLRASGTYTSEILRLAPQNDVVGQPLKVVFLESKWGEILDKVKHCSHSAQPPAILPKVHFLKPGV